MDEDPIYEGQTMLFTVGPEQHVNGTVRYLGPLKEDPTGQQWVGVELAEPVGRHSGRSYFTCQPKHGLFVRAQTAAASTRRNRAACPGRRPNGPTRGAGGGGTWQLERRHYHFGW